MSKKLKVFKVNKMKSSKTKLKNTQHDLFNYNESDRGQCNEIKMDNQSVAVSNTLKQKKKEIPKMNKMFNKNKK